MHRIAKAIILASISTSLSDSAYSNEVADGLALAKARCSQCHAIGPEGKSPLPQAPPFRTLHQRYPVRSLQEALGEGILVGHSVMPQISFTPPEIGQFIAYLESLEQPK